MAFMFPFNDLSNYQFKHVDEPLILPDDVLGMIADFSKPACRHWREFKEIKCIFEDSYMDLLAEIEKRLYTSDADQVFAALVAYKDAYVEYHYRLGFCLRERVESLIRESNAAAEVYCMKGRELNVILYGEYE
jgi:hypothetical protein